MHAYECEEPTESLFCHCGRKQCIESEKLFHFLKDLVERPALTAAQRDNRGGGVWPMFRYKRFCRLYLWLKEGDAGGNTANVKWNI